MLKQFVYNQFFKFHSSINVPEKGPVFIVGTGRSGTNFLCSCMNEFPDLSDVFFGCESPYMFREVSRLSINSKALPNYVFGYYKYMSNRVKPKIFLDQTHPNIWNVEQILKEFPGAKFIAISRDLYSVIYSMKLHKGVSEWIKKYKRYPLPNRFLGISLNNYIVYDKKLSNLQRAVFRWCSHEKRIAYLEAEFPESVMRIIYEDLSTNMSDCMNKISSFLGVRQPQKLNFFYEGSLHKKLLLNKEEHQEINDALYLFKKFDDDSLLSPK